MFQDFSIARCSRRCHRGDRELRPGEEFYSVIVECDGELARQDIAFENWNGPPEHAVGWWRQRIPQSKNRKLRPAPEGVLLDTLTELLERPGKEALAYLLSLLLIRRRVLVEANDTVLGEKPPSHDDVPTLLSLKLPADGRVLNVPVVTPTPETCEALQQQLVSLLFTEE